MVNEKRVPAQDSINLLSVIAGMLIGALAGAVAMLLLAPQSGVETRIKIQRKGFELRDRAIGMVEDSMAQVRSGANQITIGGRGKVKGIKQQGQEPAL